MNPQTRVFEYIISYEGCKPEQEEYIKDTNIQGVLNEAKLGILSANWFTLSEIEVGRTGKSEFVTAV